MHQYVLPLFCGRAASHIYITPFSTAGANSGTCRASGGGASGGGVVCLERSRLGTTPAASSAPSASGCKGSSLDFALVGELSTLGDGLPPVVPAAAATGGPAIDRVELPLLKLQSTTPLAAACMAAEVTFASSRTLDTLTRLRLTEASTPLAAACMAAEVTFASSSTLDTLTRLRLTEAEAEAEAEAATSTTRSNHSAGSDHMLRLRSAPRSEFLLVGLSCSRLCTQPCRFW